MPEDFEEIGHCGGKVTFRTVTEDGRRMYQVGYSGAAPNAMALYGIHAMPPGIAVATIKFGGLGDPLGGSPPPGCYPVLISSDGEGWFGHQCPRCRNYWRSRPLAVICPYCRLNAQTHSFLTDAQRRYVEAYLAKFEEALADPVDAEHVIDMDAVAAASGQQGEKPPFYYSEQRQQTNLKCEACGSFTDILGRFGYCSGCGTRNDLAQFEADIALLRERINAGAACNDAVRDAVAAFDTSAKQQMRELIRHVPLTPSRRNRLSGMRFHDLKATAAAFETAFDIDVLYRLSEEDIAFATIMFHRRHIYEHNGGEVDEKYIRDSGDTSVRLKQILRETREAAHRLAGLLVRIERNLHEGFHSIFPPNPERIALEDDLKRLRGSP